MIYRLYGVAAQLMRQWQGSQLVVVTQRANGGKLIRTYTLDQGAGHMIISIQAPGDALIAQSSCVLSTTLKPDDRRNVACFRGRRTDDNESICAVGASCSR